ncbi:uncharacterized protein MELLADRAFT_59562 [Melampsora larici-populina 98AG31]|uniref:Uncharacterized protein n=1 Tax=Melampsora larici-populina (strain 98AG31 / pathotype 3-4-7) TaxID=747676 RepID=F4R7Y5_MELLP|nr:uncharacterized protein MELLADRAFT_59562 [Melampsora larici-populina 98AG31]EGG11708.1 hypothetical protein MELLADRAFT_59562 [Melampsora larici-populina 98AG31]
MYVHCSILPYVFPEEHYTDPKESHQLLAPVVLYNDRPWSGLITDHYQTLLGMSGDSYSQFEDHYGHSSYPNSTSSMRKPCQLPTFQPTKRSKSDLPTHDPSRLQNWFTEPKETKFGFGSSNWRDTEKLFGTMFLNPSHHATTPSHSKLSFQVHFSDLS